jgi:hypothetical protein
MRRWAQGLAAAPSSDGAVIKARAEARSVAQRIVSEVELGLLVRSAPSRRDYRASALKNWLWMRPLAGVQDLRRLIVFFA